jgi:pimeloyl-ACP methyl ester carboxylesterase
MQLFRMIFVQAISAGRLRGLSGISLCAFLMYLFAGSSEATELILKDGRVLQGKEGRLASLSELPKASPVDGSGPIESIVFLDDDLRRTFVAKLQVREVRPGNGQIEEKFKVWQRAMHSGLKVASVGPVLEIKPFDEFGRRTFSFLGPNGPINVVQGITEISPQWSKVEGISHVWDMRIATSSIPRDMLQEILLKQIDPKNIEHQKKIARFYLQSELYEEAGNQLESMIKLFPDEPNLAADLEPTIRSLRQQAGKRLLVELRMRREAGQHALVEEKLHSFPSQGISSDVLQSVREMLDEYQTLQTRRNDIVLRIAEQFALVKDAPMRRQIEPLLKEITIELDFNALGRLTAFQLSLSDEKTPPADKLSLALSGWLLGTDDAVIKLSTSLSLYKIRGLIRQYINEPVKINREQIFEAMQSEEAATPALAAALLLKMKPPGSPLKDVDANAKPGLFKGEVVGVLNESKVSYLVQVPPEYSPFRRYPTVVTLQNSSTTPEQQIDWWAGGWTKDGWRSGQATRNGYIVIAPQWTVEHQNQFNYSAREHAAVLNCLRDACRRFSVDTDRVFLSGHGMGGNAAWDIGVAHPDLWAGVVIIGGESDRFDTFYIENARHVPFYVVSGELDGGKLTRNSKDLDRYFLRGYNVTAVEYEGRGPEHFYDEILRIFDWMSRCRRDFFPRSFSVSTMREFDNFFWWLECEGMPAKTIVDPANWPPPKGTRAITVGGVLNEVNGINASGGAGKVTIWISPKMIDFSKRSIVQYNARRLNSNVINPDLHTLLEDVRTRGDCQNPFWAKIQSP